MNPYKWKRKEYERNGIMRRTWSNIDSLIKCLDYGRESNNFFKERN